jgi:hypothetical protein
MSGDSPLLLDQGVAHDSDSSAVTLWTSDKYLTIQNHVDCGALECMRMTFEFVLSQRIARSSAGFCCGWWGSVNYDFTIHSRKRAINFALYRCILLLSLRIVFGNPSVRAKFSNSCGPSASVFNAYISLEHMLLLKHRGRWKRRYPLRQFRRFVSD